MFHSYTAIIGEGSERPSVGTDSISLNDFDREDKDGSAEFDLQTSKRSVYVVLSSRLVE